MTGECHSKVISGNDMVPLRDNDVCTAPVTAMPFNLKCTELLVAYR